MIRTMNTTTDTVRNRRRFLQFLAGSPLLAMGGFCGGIPELLGEAIQDSGLISTPEEAINVFDFRTRCAPESPAGPLGDIWPRVWTTIGRFKQIARDSTSLPFDLGALVDVTNTDLSTELFGQRLRSPIVLCPVGSQKTFHPGRRGCSCTRCRSPGSSADPFDRHHVID